MDDAIDFVNWMYDNRWFNRRDGFWCYTFEQGTAMSKETYRKHYMKTSEELYKMYLMSKEKWEKEKK